MENNVKKARVWELDAFRGLFIIGMVAVHTIYDLTAMFGLSFDPGVVYDIAKEYGSILFIVLSGICVTFGRHFLKRGLTVLGFGMLISLVMALLTAFVSESFGLIYFGILHLLGTCMILYPVFRKMPVWANCICALAAFAVGYVICDIEISAFPLLVIFGFDLKGFSAVDHFPLFPNLGWFIVGIVLGKTLYKKKQSLLPEKIGKNAVVRFFMLCGKQSLWIYVLHQPIVYGILYIIFKFI